MAKIKLPKLPDRTMVRVTINLTPELNGALADYAEAYADAYGAREPLTELIPYILSTFLDGDREFARSRKLRR